MNIAPAVRAQWAAKAREHVHDHAPAPTASQAAELGRILAPAVKAVAEARIRAQKTAT